MVGERVIAVVPNDQVVEEGDAENESGISKAFSQQSVFCAGRRVSGWMVMCDYESGSVEENRTFKDFAWMNDGLSHTSHCNVVHADEAVLGIQEDAIHVFSILVFQDGVEIGECVV